MSLTQDASVAAGRFCCLCVCVFYFFAVPYHVPFRDPQISIFYKVGSLVKMPFQTLWG